MFEQFFFLFWRAFYVWHGCCDADSYQCCHVVIYLQLYWIEKTVFSPKHPCRVAVLRSGHGLKSFLNPRPYFHGLVMNSGTFDWHWFLMVLSTTALWYILWSVPKCAFWIIQTLFRSLSCLQLNLLFRLQLCNNVFNHIFPRDPAAIRQLLLRCMGMPTVTFSWTNYLGSWSWTVHLSQNCFGNVSELD